jgi:hypothetical protein
MTHIVLHKPISQVVLDAAAATVPSGKLNRQTIHENGEGGVIGAIAEIYMLQILDTLYPDKEILDHSNQSYDYDILLGGIKLDVKAKKRTVAVRPDYDVSIAHYTKDQQKCDMYAFCSVTVDRNDRPLDFYYVGMMRKDDYFKRATFKRKGDPDGDNRLPNGQPFRIKKDCWNLKYKDLHQFSVEVLEPLKQKGYRFIQWTE